MKKKIFSIALVACIVILSIAGASVAYFTDVDDATNVFTSGNVDIALTYAGQVSPDAIIENEDVYPGQVFDVAPSIEVKSTSMDAYVGAIITLDDADIATLLAAEDTNGDADKIVAISELLQGLVVTGHTVEYDADANPYQVYVVIDAPVAANQTVTLFNNVKIPTAWGNTEMTAFNGFSLKVDAYATQTVGFEGGNVSAADALRAAFTEWAGCTID